MTAQMRKRRANVCHASSFPPPPLPSPHPTPCPHLAATPSRTAANGGATAPQVSTPSSPAHTLAHHPHQLGGQPPRHQHGPDASKAKRHGDNGTRKRGAPGKYPIASAHIPAQHPRQLIEERRPHPSPTPSPNDAPPGAGRKPATTGRPRQDGHDRRPLPPPPPRTNNHGPHVENETRQRQRGKGTRRRDPR